MFAFGLFVPLVVIVVSYFSILRVVKKVNRPAAAIIDRKIIVWRYKVFVFEKTY